jgi:predicted dehydrogenase
VAEVKTAGVIGYGSAGAKHADAYAQAGLKVAVYDPSDKHWSGNLGSVLACDVVSICSPDDTHLGYLETAVFGHRKHVLVEKPLTHSATAFNEIERIVQYGARHDLTMECHLPLRYHPPFVQALGEVRAGLLGKIVSIDMAYHYGRPEKLKGWRGQIPSYTLIVGGGIHLIDMAACIIGGYISQDTIYSVARHDRREHAAFTLGGVFCTLTTTCYEHIPHMHEMRIIGTAGEREIQNTVEVDHARGVKLFLDKVRTGQRGNIAEAIGANRVCIKLAGAIR